MSVNKNLQSSNGYFKWIAGALITLFLGTNAYIIKEVYGWEADCAYKQLDIAKLKADVDHIRGLDNKVDNIYEMVKENNALIREHIASHH